MSWAQSKKKNLHIRLARQLQREYETRGEEIENEEEEQEPDPAFYTFSKQKHYGGVCNI